MEQDEIHEGTRRTRLHNESAEHLAKREALRLVETESMKLRETGGETAPRTAPGCGG